MRGALALLALAAGVAAPAFAQDPALSLTLQGRVPWIYTRALLADGKYLGLMRSGLPLRLHYRLELWRVRSNWFDQFIRDVEWDVVARHDPLTDDFMLIRHDGSITRLTTDEDLVQALEIPYRVPLAPPAVAGSAAGRFYFAARLDVSTLNDTDLAELERWLKGEVGPAVSGDRNVGGALARGLQRILVRIAGLPRLTLEAKSPSFRTAGR
ncbi:MAG: DUF4390 domain-containing protein [Gemmatimonadales bacterium]